MKTSIRLIVITVLFAACIASESLGANFGGPINDGWHTWRVVEADGGELQIYASMKSGNLVQLRVHSDSHCQDDLDVEATDLGLVEVDESIDWLQRYIEPRFELSSDALMAISLHSGDRPVAVLATVIKSANDRKIRQEALFWLGQSDSDAAFDVFDRLLSGTM